MYLYICSLPAGAGPGCTPSSLAPRFDHPLSLSFSHSLREPTYVVWLSGHWRMVGGRALSAAPVLTGLPCKDGSASSPTRFSCRHFARSPTLFAPPRFRRARRQCARKRSRSRARMSPSSLSHTLSLLLPLPLSLPPSLCLLLSLTLSLSHTHCRFQRARRRCARRRSRSRGSMWRSPWCSRAAAKPSPLASLPWYPPALKRVYGLVGIRGTRDGAG